MLKFTRIVIFSLTFLYGLNAFASDAQSDFSTTIAQANNPLANLKAFNIQNYYYSNLSDMDTTGNTVWLRYAQPIDNFLVRASMPIQTTPVSANGARQTGTGDFNIFATYLLKTNSPDVSFGIGPMLVAPTASPSVLGAGKWQGGLAVVYFNATSHVFQYGGLVTYQADFAGNQKRAHTSILAVQPFAILQVKNGYYLRSAPIWSDDFITSSGVLPLSLGVGKVFRNGKTVYNVFVEPQFAVWHQGAGQPITQVYAGLNMQFY